MEKSTKILILCSGLFSMVACKENSISKGEMVPGVDNINTFALSTTDFEYAFKSLAGDSILSSNFSYSSGTDAAVPATAIGWYTDPYFGQVKSSAHFQLAPYSSGFSIPAQATVDSVVLVLPYVYGSAQGLFYGDTLSNISWNIYKTGNALDKNKNYYTSTETSLGDLIGTASFNYQDFKPGSLQYIGATQDTTSGQLRIKLNQSFAQELANADTSVFDNTTAFFEFFKGVSIVPQENSQNALAYFLLPTPGTDQVNANAARVELHYHNSSDTAFSSLVVRPTVCANYFNVSYNRAGFPIASEINQVADKIIVQSQPGVMSDITLKGLSKIPRAVVNRAEISFYAPKAEVSGQTISWMHNLNMVAPVLINQNGKEDILFERLDNNGSNNANGVLLVNPYGSVVTIDGKEYMHYRINIPRTVQQYVLEGKDELTIRLKGPNYYPGMYRLIGNGINGSDPQTKFQFNIVYTKH